MTLPQPRVLQKLDGAPWEIDLYLKTGGYDAWKKCLKDLTPADVVGEIKRAGLRGRGGAGFPTGIKWDKVLNHRVPERYFVCNAGEHEPGTFKDRHFGTLNPHQLIEGMILGSYALGAKTSYI